MDATKERGLHMTEDHRVVACNYTTATSIAAKGALCYLCGVDDSSPAERLEVLVRSRGGRWVRKWEDARRLGNFRVKTLPPAHPLYNDERILTGFADEWLARITGKES
jgi:hypothetical protein